MHLSNRVCILFHVYLQVSSEESIVSNVNEKRVLCIASYSLLARMSLRSPMATSSRSLMGTSMSAMHAPVGAGMVVSGIVPDASNNSTLSNIYIYIYIIYSRPFCAVYKDTKGI